MRKLIILGFTVIYMLIMTFCEYTPRVIAYVGDEENYIEIEAEVFAAKYNTDGYSYLYIKMKDFEHYEGFMGREPESYDPSLLDDTTVKLKIVPENAEILKERGFFDNIKNGDSITIHTTCWIYDNIKYHFLASVSEGENVYLSFEEGFEGIKNASVQLKDIEIKDILGQLGGEE